MIDLPDKTRLCLDEMVAHISKLFRDLQFRPFIYLNSKRKYLPDHPFTILLNKKPKDYKIRRPHDRKGIERIAGSQRGSMAG